MTFEIVEYTVNKINTTKNIFGNAQVKCTQIVKCTVWEQYKQTQSSHNRCKSRTKALRTLMFSNLCCDIKYRRHCYEFFFVNYHSTFMPLKCIFLRFSAADLHELLTPPPHECCLSPGFPVFISSHCSSRFGTSNMAVLIPCKFLGVNQ